MSRLDVLRKKFRGDPATEAAQQLGEALSRWFAAAHACVSQSEIRAADSGRARRFLEQARAWSQTVEMLTSVPPGEWVGTILWDQRDFPDGGGSYRYRELRLRSGLLTLEGGESVSDGLAASGTTDVFTITIASDGAFDAIERLGEWAMPLPPPAGAGVFRCRYPTI